MFRSATFKLTMWYLALILAISLMFSGILYHVGSNELASGLDHQSERISRQFPVFQNDPMLDPNSDVNAADRRLLLRLIIFNSIVIVGAGFASYWLAKRTLQPIEEAHEQQKRFTADVSHELRTPLTALKMESEVALMSNQTTKDELRQTLTSNLEEVSKLETLINNLLKLTRLEADELRQNFTTLHSADIAESAIKQLQPIATARAITLENKTTDLPLTGDREALIQLLVILLDNAVKYSSNGSSVELSTNSDDDHTLFVVTDHGSGIDPTSLEHVFDRFYRADNSRTKTGAEGFGLGLSIAKMIADVHGGTVLLSSRVGHGTKAEVSIPQK